MTDNAGPLEQAAWEETMDAYQRGYNAGCADERAATLARVVTLLRTNGQTWTADWLEHGALDTQTEAPADVAGASETR